MGPLFAGIGAAEGTVQLPYQPKQPAAVAVALDDRIPTRVLVRPKERETLREIHAEIEIEIDVEVERDKICTYYSSPYPCQYGPNVCTCSALVAAVYPNKTIHIPNRLCISRPCWITLVTLGHRFRQKRLVRIQMERQKKQKVRQTKIEQAKKWGVGGVGEVESDEEKNDGSNKVDTKGPQPQQQPQQQANPAPTIELEMVDRQPQPGSSMVGRPEDSDRTIVVDAFDDHGEDGDEGAFGNLGMGGGRITSLDHGPGPQEQQVGRPSDGRSSRGMSADLYHTRTSSVSSSSPSSLRKSSKRRSGRMKKKFSAGGGQVKKGHSSRTLKYLGSLGTADQISAVGSLGSKQVHRGRGGVGAEDDGGFLAFSEEPRTIGGCRFVGVQTGAFRAGCEGCPGNYERFAGEIGGNESRKSRRRARRQRRRWKPGGFGKGYGAALGRAYAYSQRQREYR